MGLHLQTQVPDEKTVRDFEAFLRERHPGCGRPRFLLLHEHIVRMCIDAGVVGKQAVWAMDSTPMWCYGAVLDTIRLLGEGTRMLAQRWAKATGASIEEIASQWDVPYVLAKSIKGHFRIDWRNAEERADVVEVVAGGALRAVEQVRWHISQARRNRRKRLQRRARALVRIVEQDLETDNNGQLVVAQKVAKDRMVSLTDPCARHGRKSRSKTFNGFKLHLLGDIVSGVIGSVAVTAGNRHDGSVAHRLIRRAKQLHTSLDVVLGDTAYGGASLRHRVHSDLGVTLVAPPPPNNTKGRKGGLRREDFDIDFEANTVTCPGGVNADERLWVWSKEHHCHTTALRWSEQACNSCRLQNQCCGERTSGRYLRLHPHEQTLRQAREDWQEPEVREKYRRRSECERLVRQMSRHGARRARSWGLGKAQLQAHLIAMRCNLQLLAQALAGG